MISYLGLFVAAFAAATIVPFSSEVIFFSLLYQGKQPWLLLLAASAGNTLGAVVNWLLGRYLLHYQDRSWFYFNAGQLARMQVWFRRYGIYSLLFSWVPLGGDVLTCIAGIMRVPFLLFLLLVALGKTCRYMVVLYLYVWAA